MQRYRFHLIFAACSGVVVALLAWLLVSPDSPVVSSSPVVLNAVGLIHIIPFTLATIITGNIHGGSDTAYWAFVFAQWLIVGLGLAYFADCEVIMMLLNEPLMTNRRSSTPLVALENLECVPYAPALLSAAVAYLNRSPPHRAPNDSAVLACGVANVMIGQWIKRS